MSVVERFRRPDFGHLLLDIRIDDPKTYAKPVELQFSYTLFADTDMIEDICENEKDYTHMGSSSAATNR
jgi:hypothetical protein